MPLTVYHQKQEERAFGQRKEEKNEKKKVITGYTMVVESAAELGMFRPFIEKLLVSPTNYWQRVARRILMKEEKRARSHGQTLLVKPHNECNVWSI